MKERLEGSDYRFIAVCLALLAATTWFSIGNFYRAFPEASIDFRVNRDGGEALAAKFLTEHGFATGGYREASSFGFDDDAKTFLEREAGLEQANQLMGSKIRLWRWSYRWFRPLEKEEFNVDITPLGELAGFSHELPEDAARAATTVEQARSLAEDFLRGTMHRDLATLEFVESAELARPHRTDRVFTWKEGDFNLHDATSRVEVTVLGNEVGAYREFLKIPEEWSRDYQRIRSKNDVAQTVDTAFLVAMVVGIVVVIVMRVRRHDIRWRRAAVVGTVGTVLSLCSSLNQFSQQEFQYPTTDSYSSFVTRQLLQALIGALGAGGLLFVLTAGAEPLYREMFPDKVSLGNLFRPHGLRTKRFFLGSILGITLTGIFIAYQTAFYIVAYRFGAWSPADVPYSDLLNTRFPWLFVLFGGFLPAVSEEFMFRMFGIPFLRKLTRSMAAAVILAGFIWGFGHSAYPQQPFFIRGTEVGIGGVALGLVMLRWGILPTLVWHYSVDAMYSAMLLLRSHSLYYKLSGAASAGIIVLPVLLAFVAYLRRGGFEPAEGLRNGDEGGAVESEAESAPTAEPASIGYRTLSLPVRLAALAVFAAGLLALLMPVSHMGDSPRYQLTKEQAFVSADSFLRSQGLNSGGFQHVTFPATHWSGPDSLAGKYFLEQRPVQVAAKLFEENRPVQHWATRYFKSLDQEEVMVSVHPESGKLLAFIHALPENRPGADVTDEAASRIASEFAGRNGRDLANMDLKQNTTEKKKARRDHELEWEARAGDPRNLDEAHFRVTAEVAGDQVTKLGNYWKLPESFERARSQQNGISIVTLVLRFGSLTGLVVWGILLLVQNIRKGLVPWRLTIRVAVAAAIVASLARLLSIDLTLQNYNTAIPLETFKAMMYIVILMSVVFGFLMLGAAVAMLTSFFPDCTAALRRAHRRVMGADAAVALLAAIGLGLAVHQAQGLLQDRFHAQANFSFASPDLMVSTAPAVEALADGVRSTIFFAALLGAAVLLIGRLRHPALKLGVLLLAACNFLPTDVRTVGEFALSYGLGLLVVVCAFVFCEVFARGNYLAYLLVLWALSLRGALGQLFQNSIPSMHVQGWIVVAAIAATILWVVLPAMGERATVQGQTA